MSKQLPPLPHQTILRTLHSEELPEPPYTVYGFTSEQLQAYATAATEPLLQRIAELERQLEEARKDAERWRTFLSTRPKATHDVINQAIDDEAMQKGQP